MPRPTLPKRDKTFDSWTRKFMGPIGMGVRQLNVRAVHHHKFNFAKAGSAPSGASSLPPSGSPPGAPPPSGSPPGSPPPKRPLARLYDWLDRNAKVIGVLALIAKGLWFVFGLLWPSALAPDANAPPRFAQLDPVHSVPESSIADPAADHGETPVDPNEPPNPPAQRPPRAPRRTNPPAPVVVAPVEPERSADEDDAPHPPAAFAPLTDLNARCPGLPSTCNMPPKTSKKRSKR